MDTRNSALVVASYLVGGIVVALVALSYYAATDRSGGGLGFHWDLPTSPGTGSVPGRSTIPRPVSPQTTPPSRPVPREVAVTRDLLEKRTRALSQKTSECQALREQLDQSYQLIIDLLAVADRREEGSGNAETSAANSSADLDRLKSTLSNWVSQDASRERQLAELEAELIQSEMELALVQEESQERLDALRSENRVIEETTSELVARCGNLVVPLLVELLRDERVEMRRWAARTLGAMGLESIDALPALQLTLTDPDQAVRDRAEEAIDAITGITPPASK